MISAQVTRAVVLLSAIALSGFGFSPAAAQEPAADVAYVVSVIGRVVASTGGTPGLLDSAAVIGDRARLDLMAHSELQVCHYGLQRFVTMTGPARVTVSTNRVMVESGKVAVVSRETCATPQASNFQGGVVTRGVSLKQ